MTADKAPAVVPVADRIGEFLNRSLVSVPVTATLGEAAVTMAGHRISSVLVVAGQRAAGIVTERDLLRAYRRRIEPSTPITAFMGQPVLTCDADCDYREAYRLLERQNIHHLVIVDSDDDRPLGVISESDFRAHLGGGRNASRILVAAAMTPDPLAVPATVDILTAATMMERAGTTAAVIVEDRLPWGIVTARDIVVQYRDGGDPHAAITGIMTTPLITVAESDTLASALALMQERRIRRLVTVDADGHLAGLLTQSDLVAHLDLQFQDMAERRRDRARQALRRAQAQLRVVFDDSPHFIGLLDSDGLLLEANATALRAVDCLKGELLGRPFWETPWWTHDADQQQRLRDAIAAAARGEPQHFEASHRTAADLLIWVDFTLHPIHDEAGRINYLLPQGVDITQRKLAMEELRTLSRAVEQANLSIVITDTQGTIRYVNPWFCWLTGYSRDEVIGSNPRMLNSGHQEAAFYAKLWEIIQSGRTWQGELCNRKKDGTLYWEEATISPVRDEAGTITHFVAVKEDITDQRAADDRLRLAASVYSSSHEGIIITDPEGIVVDINTAFERITGYSRAEMVGHKANLVSSGHHDKAFFAHMWGTLRRDGIWRGEIVNRRKNGELLVELLTISAVRDTFGAVTHYVGAFTDITELKKSQERLNFLAHFDPLTGLPNRSLLTDRISQALVRARRQKKLLAVAYLDLDGFAPINDSHGHEIGDRVLVEIATRLGQALRGVDTVARIGGDEFVLLLPDIEIKDELNVILERVLAAVTAPLTSLGLELSLGSSIGVTVYPNDGGDPETLLRHASQAMFAAKETGGNVFELFDAEQDKRSRSHREVSVQLREGLARGELVLWYQPKVNMREGRVEGVEALIRWQHPERGLVPPGEFLPQVENTDFIVEIGNWVLEQAACQIERWRESGIDLTVSVNIAARHLQRPDFADGLRTLLARHPALRPDQLEIEILETAALEDMAGITRLIDECRGMGIQFALDDFGTGYASLAYFRQLPARTLKIDQGFVRDMLDDPADLAIVEAVIGLTSAFQRMVIAEGVETAAHGKLLLQLGCDHAQGYGIARPMPATALNDWLKAFVPDAAWAEAATNRVGRDGFQVLMASMQIRRWVARLFAGELPHIASDAQLCDPHLCEFGRWYDGPGMEQLGRLSAFCEIDPLHAQMHATVGPYLAALRSGKEDEAAAARTRIEELRDRIVDLLEALRYALVLYRLPLTDPTEK